MVAGGGGLFFLSGGGNKVEGSRENINAYPYVRPVRVCVPCCVWGRLVCVCALCVWGGMIARLYCTYECVCVCVRVS